MPSPIDRNQPQGDVALLQIGPAKAVEVPIAEFLQGDFASRISFVLGRLRSFNHRPSSLQLCRAWVGLIDQAHHFRLTKDQVRSLTEEAIALQPESEFADRLFEILFDDHDNDKPQPERPIFLIISCEKYYEKAAALCSGLSRDNSNTLVVTGDRLQSSAVRDGSRLIVPAGDAYEDLPSKVMESLLYVRRNWKNASVFKIDDDAKVVERTRWDLLSELIRATQYCGYVNDPRGRCMDRCWHIGKGERRLTPYSGQYRTKYASGALYYLSSNAVDQALRTYFKFKDEFGIELYEDKAMGAVLAGSGIEPDLIDLAGPLGLEIDMHG